MTATTADAPVIRKPTRLQGITDLTVLARIKAGFVPGTFNAITYVERLMRVLTTLNALRLASQEASVEPNPFTDSIGRFRAIHFFRFAVVPTNEVPPSHLLLLNVTFDGGWEPYMRIIWDPLGTLLDLIFCHCEDYPMAFESTFEQYTRWVREHEVPSSLFYVDSAATVGDLHYLRRLESQIRNKGGGKSDDLDAAVLAMRADALPPPPSALAVTTSLRLLKAFEPLREFFPSNQYAKTDPAQDGILLRFIQDLLRDLRDWRTQGLFKPGGRHDDLGAAFESELAWLGAATPSEKKDSDDALKVDPAHVQMGIHRPYPSGVRHGVLVLLRIKSPDKTRKWLSKAPAPVTNASEEGPADGIFRTLALTYTGLQRLGIAEDTLRGAPREFIEGMEARAGLLGDVRGNHPDYWKRPRRNWPWERKEKLLATPPIELSTVHVLVQFRTAFKDGDEEPEPDGTQPLPRLATAIKALDGEETGLQVLFVQPMKVNSTHRDHFGYADGLSQPTFDAPAQKPPLYWSDQIKKGDLFIGYSNSRTNKPQPKGKSDRLFDNGSFFVVRKLRQYSDRFDRVVNDNVQRLQPGATTQEQRFLKERIKAKLMGRETDGSPLVSLRGTENNFDFQSDAKGQQCPFQSHIRRANPREVSPLQPTPRIARRGMSYGPPTEVAGEPRGIIFMAYNASIAEQFEVIQRWLTGGNSSGLSSAQSDPFVGVPEAGQPRTFRYADEGRVVRVDLGNEPLVELEWGLYAFVPSIDALEAIASIAEAPPVKASKPKGSTPLSDRDVWKLRIEDDKVRVRTWQTVRDEGGALNAKGYGVLVGSEEKVRQVLSDDGSTFSVKGYCDRMKESIDVGFLGLDDVGPNGGHAEQAPEVNKVIESISEVEAFDAARAHAEECLEELLVKGLALTGMRSAPVHVVDLGRDILAKLCSYWFGLPDGLLMFNGKRAQDRLDDGKARCPGHFLTVSKYIFSPHETEAVSDPAKKQGKLLLKAVEDMLAKPETLKPLVRDIISTEAMKKGGRKLQAATVAGVMLGFPPTVLANLVGVLIRWSESRQLWELQQDLLDLKEGSPDAAVLEFLRDPFLQTMREAPVPYVVWRTPVKDKPLGFDANKGDPVVVGLGSAVAGGGDSMLMFGGERDGKSTHACPGQKMAMGVMLGITAALLRAGTLRRTPDPRVLMLAGK